MSFDYSNKIRSLDISLREFPENEISATLNAKITHETLLANFIVRTVMNDKAVKCVSALFFQKFTAPYYVPTLKTTSVLVFDVCNQFIFGGSLMYTDDDLSIEMV